MKIPEAEKAFTSTEAYNFVANIGFPVIHGGGSKATRELLELIGINEKTRVLDIACGSGYTTCLIAEIYGAQVVGIDISENMIEKAKKRVQKNKLENKVKIQKADVYQLPFEEGEFDVVIFESLLTPLTDEVNALKEMHRVLRPGGILGANEGVFDVSTPFEFLELIAKHPSFSGNVFTAKELKTTFESVSFEIIEFLEKPFEMNIVKELGVKGIISFMILKYPGLVIKLLKDSRFRNYWRLDEEVNKQAKEYGKFVLLTARKN